MLSGTCVTRGERCVGRDRRSCAPCLSCEICSQPDEPCRVVRVWSEASCAPCSPAKSARTERTMLSGMCVTRGERCVGRAERAVRRASHAKSAPTERAMLSGMCLTCGELCVGRGRASCVPCLSCEIRSNRTNHAEWYVFDPRRAVCRSGPSELCAVPVMRNPLKHNEPC
jgi:hypothetical protein